LHGGAAERRPVATSAARLWQVWWLWGAAAACVIAGLVLLAEEVRLEGEATQGDILDIVRLAVYWAWGWAVWKSARNVERPLWTPLARAGVLAGLALMFLI
jgi:hypothetical protein